MLQAGLFTGSAKGMADVGRPVVGHHALDLDAEAREPGERLTEEEDGALLVFVGQHPGEGQARAIVDADVQEVPAGAAALRRAAAGDRLRRLLAPSPSEIGSSAS